MTNKEIKIQCESLYALIKVAQDDLAEIRKACPHEHTHEGLWSWAEGHIIPANICSYCGDFISSREETLTPLKVTS